NPLARQNLRAEAKARGIAAERLVFADIVPDLSAHLSRQRLADLFLDTFPYNAHATACHALWAGVPLLTCSGQSFPSRVAGSALSALGLTELIAPSLDAYEAKALELGTDRNKLARIREKLLRQRNSAPLFDTDRFRQHLEKAFATMVERYRAGKVPESF